MASTSSSPLSLVLLRPLPCRSLLLSKHRKPFPTPRTGRLAASAAAGAQQRLLRPPETGRWSRSSRSGRDFACLSYNNPPPPSDKDSNEWPILRRWDVPWEWQTVVLSMVGCGVSFALTGLVEQSILQYVGFSAAGATIDEKAEILFLGQLSVTAVVLGVIFSITNTFRPFPDDVFRYDVKEPFKLQNGWLLWAGIGLFGAVISIALVGAAMTYLNGAPPERELTHLMGSGYYYMTTDLFLDSLFVIAEGLTGPFTAPNWLINSQHCLFGGNNWSSSTNSGGDCVPRISNGVLD
uniref:Uncharacterized protein n=1 Tax=Triticum urartu TaxID=4572 RepID=A0A8R7QEX8_TRIUA